MLRFIIKSAVAISLIGVVAALVAWRLTAQEPPTPSGFLEQRMSFVPATFTDVFTDTTQMIKVMLSNTSASPVTCSLKNKGTGCGGAACTFWPAISLPANTIQAIDMSGIQAMGGVQWSCSTGNVVVGAILGRR